MKSEYTVILANGAFPQHPTPLSYLQDADYIVCCDGAANEFIARGGVPDAIVGDCDSISEENRQKFTHILHPVADQNTNDLTKAVQLCTRLGKTDIVILGATGNREDHSIGNIGLLGHYLSLADVKMVTDFGVFTPITSTTTFRSFPKQQVSLFCMTNSPLTTYGLRYPLNNARLSCWWEGTLNECISDEFTIETEGCVVVFTAF